MSYNFVCARRDFKRLAASEMDENLAHHNDSARITKIFWGYVKYQPNSSQPDRISYNNITRFKPKEQADLFNKFVFGQFSESSNYNVRIDYANDHQFDIHFSSQKIQWTRFFNMSLHVLSFIPTFS